MGHNLNINNRTGKARMFYVGEEPWHGLGIKLNEPATAKQAIVAADLDYKVEKAPLSWMVGDHKAWIEDHKAVVRMDTKQALGVVGDGYKLIQNVEAFSFFDTIVGEGKAIYHTAGALGRGERIWVLAKLPKDLVIAREDVVEKYMILTNSHDGTSALKCYFSPVRVVCQNTLSMSLKDAKDGISIRHSGDIMSKVKEARRVLGISIKYYETFEEIAQFMAKKQLSKADVETYFDKVLGIDKAREKESAVLENRKDDLLGLFEHGKGNDRPGVRGSLWAGYNAVTEFVDHYKTIKGQGDDPTNRLKSIWFGAGARLKEKAFDEAYALVGAKR